MVLAAIYSRITRPEIDVGNLGVRLPVDDPLSAKVFEPEILASVRIVDDLALVELPRCRRKCQWVSVRGCASGFVAATKVVRGSWARRVVVGVADLSTSRPDYFRGAWLGLGR